MIEQRYWLGVVSESHVRLGEHGGFAQVCHGKKAPLARLKPNDWLIYYSPKVALDSTEKLQAFTAIGVVIDDVIFQYQMSNDFKPFRRNVDFKPCRNVFIKNLKSVLEMTQEKNWGYQLRFGLIELSKHDFNLIKQAMLV